MTNAIDDLPAILDTSTTVHSKEDDGHVERWGTQSLPPVSAAAPGSVLIDLHFVIVAVHMDEAEHNAPRLVEILETYPESERLAGGPNYVELGSWVGTPDYGLRLIALGAALGLWDAITPAVEGVTGEDADKAVDAGGVFMSGYPDGVAASADVDPEPLAKESDPELDRLLAEEEEIERQAREAEATGEPVEEAYEPAADSDGEENHFLRDAAPGYEQRLVAEEAAAAPEDIAAEEE